MELKDEVIFILSLMKFDGLASTNFTMAKYLAKDNDVYYIEHPYTFKDYFKFDKTSKEYLVRKNYFKKRSNGLMKEKIDGVNIVISPLVFPVNFLPVGKIFDSFYRQNERMIVQRIKSIIKEKNIKSYLFINFYNFHLPTVSTFLKAKLNIYYCVDPIPDYDKKHGIRAEKIVVQNADVVICTSKALYEEKKKINKNAYFVPNGSDLVEEIAIPGDIASHPLLDNITRPIVGYIGAIERRIDYDLLQKVIIANPKLSFVFTGPMYTSYIPDWFFQQGNIHFIKPISYDEVPAMISGFDICIIPFKKDKLSNAIFPLKLFEYLGMGKPVILTDFNMDIKDYTEDTVVFAGTGEKFTAALQEYLVESDTTTNEKRIRIAKNNTWKKRADMVSSIIKHHLV